MLLNAIGIERLWDTLCTSLLCYKMLHYDWWKRLLTSALLIGIVLKIFPVDEIVMKGQPKQCWCS